MTRVNPRDLPDRINDDGEGVWDTVSEESAEVVTFSEPGQSFIGTYVGEETIEPPNDEPFTRYLFRDRDDVLRAVNQSYKIEQGMNKVNAGDMVRITYVKEIPTKKGFNPMKDFTVQVRRS